MWAEGDERIEEEDGWHHHFWRNGVLPTLVASKQRGSLYRIPLAGGIRLGSPNAELISFNMCALNVGVEAMMMK